MEQVARTPHGGFEVRVVDTEGNPVAGARVQDERGSIEVDTHADGVATVPTRSHPDYNDTRKWALVASAYGFEPTRVIIDPTDVSTEGLELVVTERPAHRTVAVTTTGDVRPCADCRVFAREQFAPCAFRFKDGVAWVPITMKRGQIVWYHDCPRHRIVPPRLITVVSEQGSHLRELILHLVSHTRWTVSCDDLELAKGGVVAFMPDCRADDFERRKLFRDTMYRDRTRHRADLHEDGRSVVFLSLSPVPYTVVVGGLGRAPFVGRIDASRSGRIELALPQTAAQTIVVQLDGNVLADAIVVPGHWSPREWLHLVVGPRNPPNLHAMWSSPGNWARIAEKLCFFGGGSTDSEGSVTLRLPKSGDGAVSVVTRDGSLRHGFCDGDAAVVRLLDANAGTVSGTTAHVGARVVVTDDVFGTEGPDRQDVVMASGLQVPVDHDGHFRFKSVPDGAYVALLVRGDLAPEFLGWRRILVKPGAHVVIDF